MNVSHNNTLSVERVNDYIILNTNRLVFNLVGFFFACLRSASCSQYYLIFQILQS